MRSVIAMEFMESSWKFDGHLWRLNRPFNGIHGDCMEIKRNSWKLMEVSGNARK